MTPQLFIQLAAMVGGFFVFVGGLGWKLAMAQAKILLKLDEQDRTLAAQDREMAEQRRAMAAQARAIEWMSRTLDQMSRKGGSIPPPREKLATLTNAIGEDK